MLANNNPDIKEAVTTIYQLTEDEKVRTMCERREKALFIERSRQHMLEQQKQEIAQLSSENTQLSSQNAELSSEIEHLKKLLAEHNISIDE